MAKMGDHRFAQILVKLELWKTLIHLTFGF